MDNDELNKSKHGNDFKKELLTQLVQLYKTGQVISVQTGKKFSYDKNHSPQFLAPYLLKTNNKKVAIFTTTSIRSDRLKITQWDSWGIKKNHDDNIVCVLVLPNYLTEKENKNYLKETNKITGGKYYSAIDSILKLKDLNNFLKNI